MGGYLPRKTLILEGHLDRGEVLGVGAGDCSREFLNAIRWTLDSGEEGLGLRL